MGTLAAEAARLLRVREKDLLSLRVLRRSVDAREEVRLVYTVEVSVKDEASVLRRVRSRKVSRAVPQAVYAPPAPLPAPAIPPVVAGAGPAGLFAALVLARAGQRPILLERGRPVEQRKADVERFWATGELDLTSNVQFGEGGAGAFSDGKLNTGTKDLRHRFILETLVSCGAPEDILIDAKPHVGTDFLHIALVNLRRRLLELGADIRFESRLADLDIRDGALAGITVEGPAGTYALPCRQLILCPGHSARDTFEMLYERGVPMEAKPFAVGVRIEHRQADCDAAQYRQYAGHPGLPASTYKLSCHPDSFDKVLYTGPIDEYFQYSLGHLEYRSVRFETEELDMENYQGNAVVNYTDREVPYTRIIEHKHFEFGTQPTTIISREYSAEWKPGMEPYYPVNDEKNNELFAKYRELAEKEPKVIFGGRLGNYKYYNMDQVIEAALETAGNELKRKLL